MKQVCLGYLALRNFMGIKNFRFQPSGQDAAVFGDNATGKSTINTAFTWLLFAKDSAGRADFEIKTLDKNGEPIHGLDQTVSAELSVDGELVELKKTYREKWQKRRGSAEAVFTGNTTDHFINGVPVKEKQYRTAVDEIADENIFRLLTDPVHFAERLHWQERRRILLDVCGDVSDEDVIASADQLGDLPGILEGRSIDDHRKVAQSRKRAINDELQRVPVRIDEVSRSIPQNDRYGYGSVEALRSNLEGLREKRAGLETRRMRIEGGGEVAEKNKRLRELEGELLEAANQAKAKSTERADALQKAMRDIESEIDTARRKATRLTQEIDYSEVEINSLEAKMEDCRGKWHAIDGRTWSPEAGDRTCAACGQELPPQRVADARQKALAQFNAEKSRQLEELAGEGKRLRERRDRHTAENKDRETARKATEEAAESLEPKLRELRQDLEKELQSEVARTPTEREENLADQYRCLNQEIAELRKDNKEALTEVDKELEELDGRILSIQTEFSRIEQWRAAEKRIDELRKEERRLAAEYEETERELYLCEHFVRRKVSMLTERINSRFENVRFKLFEELVNGGVQEVCEASVGGVPWGSLNHGGRINGGLEIIDVLAEHFGIAPCIWIDQSESITKLKETRGQQIRLVVSSGDKELRVEKERL